MEGAASGGSESKELASPMGQAEGPPASQGDGHQRCLNLPQCGCALGGLGGVGQRRQWVVGQVSRTWGRRREGRTSTCKHRHLKWVAQLDRKGLSLALDIFGVLV